jgi:hypothetical protein
MIKRIGFIFGFLIPCKLFAECRTLLKIMAEDIAPLLHGLVDVIWTAKKLHAILCRENI